MIRIMHVLCTGNNCVTKETISSHNVQMDNNFEGILLFCRWVPVQRAVERDEIPHP